MKKLLFAILFVGAFFVLSFLLTQRFFAVQQTSQTDPKKISVVASFYPLYFFAQNIGGSFAKVTNLTPAGSEPHDYDPSPQQISNIVQSKLLILNGKGLEAWSEKIKQNLQGKPVLVITTSEDVKATDPHLWLSPIQAKKQVQKILQGFLQVDPTHQTQYEQHAQMLTEQLEGLDTLYKKGLTNCKQNNIVTSHAAFGHLAEAYGLNQVSISGISPDEEPSPAQLATVANFVKANHVTVIFFESLVSPKLSETIARETGARTAVLNPLEGLSDDEIQSGSDYFSVMKENLATLRLALECR
ncbi:MAG: zinc ABC transporter substrate-binding protein [Patescibacteria group bacterium]